MDIDKCTSCGMPMGEISDRGGNIEFNPHCKYCTDENGKLLPKRTIRNNMVRKRMMTVKTTKDKAEKWVEAYMKKMPEWKKKK
ncbi:hypothetical protein JW868_03235 [Candidatus Woesearchaeota archaeon]|nr:hypothetical protein [Candidatus Woesearchaeota archaeon]